MLFKALALITLILIIFTPIDTFNNIETFYNPYKVSDSSILQGKYYKYTDKRDKRQFKKRRRTVRQIQTGKLRIKDTVSTGGGYYEANDYPFTMDRHFLIPVPLNLFSWEYLQCPMVENGRKKKILITR